MSACIYRPGFNEGAIAIDDAGFVVEVDRGADVVRDQVEEVAYGRTGRSRREPEDLVLFVSQDKFTFSGRLSARKWGSGVSGATALLPASRVIRSGPGVLMTLERTRAAKRNWPGLMVL